MIIKKAEFEVSAVNPGQYPDNFHAEIALLGRSNVGKSSLINKFINRKSLARTSSQPGKTQTLNFYHINDTWYFVDLPGYGYAKVSKDTKDNWKKFIEQYLLNREQLSGLIMLVDLRHPPSADDKMMYEWLAYNKCPCLIVATKADKISRGLYEKHKRIIQKGLELSGDAQIILFSAQTGLGLETIQQWVENRIAEFTDNIGKA